MAVQEASPIAPAKAEQRASLLPQKIRGPAPSIRHILYSSHRCRSVLLVGSSLASEGSAGKSLGDTRQMFLGIGTLKTEGEHKTRTLGVASAAGAFAVSKITDDHITSRTNWECRSLERGILQGHVHHLFGLRREFALLVDVHVHRQHLTVGPLPRAALACSGSGLGCHQGRRRKQPAHLSS